MARLQNYGQVVASLNGWTFYSNPRKRTRKTRAPITPALKENLARLREERRNEYTQALKGARDTINKHTLQLRETFGGHSTKYYTQEILQRGRIERGRRKPSRWNAYLRHELKKRNEGMRLIGTSFIYTLLIQVQPCPLGSQNYDQPTLSAKSLKHGV